MKITIYGTGAIGGFLAIGLHQTLPQGHTISLIARGAQLKAIRQNGLKLQNEKGELTNHVFFPSSCLTDDPRSLGPQDVVIVSLKSHQALAAVNEIRSLLGEETVIVSAMNGIPWWYCYGLNKEKMNPQYVIF
jgi:2-dehydropantoate 2-reductase